MKKNHFVISSILLVFLFISCVNGQTKTTNLSAVEFSNKIKQLPKAPIIDVRTPEEFLKGHLKNAKNFNVNGSDFSTQISKLDKAKPVFVYCLS